MNKVFLIPVTIIATFIVLALLIPTRTEATNNIVPNGECEKVCTNWEWEKKCSKKIRNICVDWDWEKVCKDWEYKCTPSTTPTNTPSVTETPTATPSATLTLEPTEAPKKGFEMGGAPETKCENPKAVPTVIWTDNYTFMWSPSDPNVKEYVVEYRIGENTYTTVVRSQDITFNEHVDSIRTAGLSNGCRGEFSTWSSESKPSGNK